MSIRPASTLLAVALVAAGGPAATNGPATSGVADVDTSSGPPALACSDGSAVAALDHAWDARGDATPRRAADRVASPAGLLCHPAASGGRLPKVQIVPVPELADSIGKSLAAMRRSVSCCAAERMWRLVSTPAVESSAVPSGGQAKPGRVPHADPLRDSTSGPSGRSLGCRRQRSR